MLAKTNVHHFSGNNVSLIPTPSPFLSRPLAASAHRPDNCFRGAPREGVFPQDAGGCIGMLTLPGRSSLGLLVGNSTDVLQWRCWTLEIRISWARRREQGWTQRDRRTNLAQKRCCAPQYSVRLSNCLCAACNRESYRRSACDRELSIPARMLVITIFTIVGLGYALWKRQEGRPLDLSVSGLITPFNFPHLSSPTTLFHTFAGSAVQSYSRQKMARRPARCYRYCKNKVRPLERDSQLR